MFEEVSEETLKDSYALHFTAYKCFEYHSCKQVSITLEKDLKMYETLDLSYNIILYMCF